MRLKNDASTDTRLTMPRTARSSPTTSWPNTCALPPSGSSSVESSRTSVDLPEPFWPSTATHSPRAIANDTSSSATTGGRFLRVNSLRSWTTCTADMTSPRNTRLRAGATDRGGARQCGPDQRVADVTRTRLHPRTRVRTRLLRDAVDAAPDTQRVVLAQLGRQHALRRVLERDRAREAMHRGHPDRRVRRARGRRERAAVVHAVGDRDAGGEAVEDDAPRAVGERGHDLGHVLATLRVQRPAELAVDALERGEQLIARAMAQQQHDRSEVLLEEL